VEDQEYEDDGQKSIFISSVNNKVLFYGEINRASAIQLNGTLIDTYNEILHTMISTGLSNPVIELHIDSSGGNLFETLSIVRTIKNIQKGISPLNIPFRVDTYIDGEASSGASIISIHGNRRFMDRHAMMLVHNPIGSLNDGNQYDFEKYVNQTKLIGDDIKFIYLSKIKMKKEDLEALLKEEKYISAETALEYGFIDEILE
jgi:ATP-dependent protease ClpP protease subunit